MSLPDCITWNAPTGEHPARAASQRSYAAVAAGDLERWLEVYAEVCGWSLAHTHARSGDPVATASYLGRGGDVAATDAREDARDEEQCVVV